MKKYSKFSQICGLKSYYYYSEIKRILTSGELNSLSSEIKDRLLLCEFDNVNGKIVKRYDLTISEISHRIEQANWQIQSLSEKLNSITLTV